MAKAVTRALVGLLCGLCNSLWHKVKETLGQPGTARSLAGIAILSATLCVLFGSSLRLAVVMVLWSVLVWHLGSRHDR